MTLQFKENDRICPKYRKQIQGKPQRRKKHLYRKYRENHREEINEKEKLRYIADRKKRSEKMQCECGGSFRRDGRADHLKTKIHQYWVEHGVPKPPPSELEKLNKQYEYLPCPCSGCYTRQNKAKHLITNRNKQYLVELMDESDEEDE